MKRIVTVVDYGAGNLHSVSKALTHLGAGVVIARDGEAIERAERLILPGVGAFGEGMAGLARRGQIEAVRAFAASGRPFLGICLGAQLLMDESEEFGTHRGLGIIPGKVVLIPCEGVKVPHVGWQKIRPPRDDAWKGTLLAATPLCTWAYFVHSYHCMPDDAADLCALAIYGGHPIAAAVSRNNVTGVQFHPEKSGKCGLTMLETFLDLRPSL
jgi:glutamine amidotransferase